MKITTFVTTLLGATAISGMAMAADLRIGINEDPDTLDPAQSRTFVSSMVYESLCNRLVNTDTDMQIIPELATEWAWSDDGMALVMQLRQGVVHHDGTPFNADSAKRVLERNLSLTESRRKAELASVESLEATGEHELTIHLKAPDVTLLAQLAHHAGRMYSPDAAEAASDGGRPFGAAPVCTGPYKFANRVEGDRIVLEKFADYWEADQYHYDRVIYMPIPDTTVRLANVRAGDLDISERTAPSDVESIRNDSRLQLEQSTSIGYQGITLNVGNGPRAEKPLGANKLVRQALSWAIDREALNQVVFEGMHVPGNQWASPVSPWYDETDPVPGRDVEKAKALLAEAGVEGRLAIEMQTGNSPIAMQAGQVIQAMAAEAGIDISLRSSEFATMLAQNAEGNFELSLQGWSGRVDPDANIHPFVYTTGANNDGKYSNPEIDALLEKARTIADPAERKALYDQTRAILKDDLPLIYLYHVSQFYTLRNGIEGFVPYNDGIIRLRGVSG
ncbi:ABC transporter substrate-binding protein [Paracoccus sp. (in: a-proteobacteria)]|uniref:ABC transporter substrate-binding protein n=1 Tax=Paracoccus sp. TaxID=267 RepID=UPI0026E0C6E8|nr:ABC transporter substrate-binding protein [Paracoccus sp. (in: a-proteobacteria)]MDO5647661.1 ABC transporter substrate-binding protein [Paracoccus sp. (in: a-proteobacteria)]